MFDFLPSQSHSLTDGVAGSGSSGTGAEAGCGAYIERNDRDSVERLINGFSGDECKRLGLVIALNDAGTSTCCVDSKRDQCQWDMQARYQARFCAHGTKFLHPWAKGRAFFFLGLEVRHKAPATP